MRDNQSFIKHSGLLLVDKPSEKTSFSLVSRCRKLLQVKKIGHAGTLDPLATGVVVLLIGSNYTKLSDRFLHQDKEYLATLSLGFSTDTYDREGAITEEATKIPSLEEVQEVISRYQGTVFLEVPMYSAKKVNGKKLCDLARKGIVVPRKPTESTLTTTLISYNYPSLELHIECSKGTYIRSIAHQMGQELGCFAHLGALRRVRSGQFHLKDCLDGNILFDPNCPLDIVTSRLMHL